MPHFTKALLLIAAVIVVSSCSHPLEIYGEGDIVTTHAGTGTRGCTLEQFQANNTKCTKNYIVNAYTETYTAVPRPGWKFRGWTTYCAHKSTTTDCSFNQPASKVFQNWGKTLWPLRAEFLEDCVGCVESLAPMLGAVTDSSIKIWQATGDDATFKVLYRVAGSSDPLVQATAVINAASGYVATVVLTGLAADTEYEYETQLNDVTKINSTFSTLPATAGFTGQLRFGLGTDFAHHEQPFLTLGHAVTKDFDFMLMIGDLMYSDLHPAAANNVAAYTDRYWITWNESNFRALSTTTPMFVMWDDHEIINDYWPGKNPVDRYPAARAAYDLYMGSHNPDTTGGVIYYGFSAPGADFFVLDTRSYRDPEPDPDDNNKSMLGETQRDALLDYLEASTAPFKFVVTSVPFSLGEESQDTWSNYKTERNYILSQIESRGIQNVAFLSGDRHWSGIFRIISPGGYVYYDFLPSPSGMSFRPAPIGNAHVGEEEIVYITDLIKMFGDFEIDLSGATPTLRAAFVGDNGVDQCVITIGNDETGVLAGLPLATCE